MSWNKIGFYSVPQGRHTWMYSHAQLPTPLVISHNLVRVFFATRDSLQRSHISFVDIKIHENNDCISIINEANEPVLEPGPLGYFDEHGVYPPCIVYHDGLFYLFYIGWNKGHSSPMFYTSIGLAVSTNGKDFIRDSPAPIMSRSKFDPCLVTSPHVYIQNGVWRMSYVSGVKWSLTKNGQFQSHYNIKIAEGYSPRDFIREGKIAIDFGEEETNIARSSVIYENDSKYSMWFSFVHSKVGKYRIGYAESVDGNNWVRKDELAGIGLDNEYCKEMICYPAVFKLQSGTYMLYNGDNYGEKGFGVACLSK